MKIFGIPIWAIAAVALYVYLRKPESKPKVATAPIPGGNSDPIVDLVTGEVIA